MAAQSETTAELARAVIQGERRALSRAITLLESHRNEDEAAAEVLLGELLPHAGRALRLAFTGPPGVGKSTLIDAFGLSAIERGLRVAVLAVDPSSTKSGGSILGDKTRMARLAARPESYIRPSPSAGAAGGVAPRTREAILACEAAGHGLVMVETVGVGQGEFEAAELCDCLVVCFAAGAGDELQGMKRGIIEHADLLCVCKADGVDRERAERAAAELASALSLVSGERRPVLTLSALEGRGLPELWDAVQAFVNGERAAARFEQRRSAQDQAWFRRAVDRGLRSRLLGSPELLTRERDLAVEVARGALTPRQAARQLFDAIAERLARPITP